MRIAFISSFYTICSSKIEKFCLSQSYTSTSASHAFSTMSLVFLKWMQADKNNENN